MASLQQRNDDGSLQPFQFLNVPMFRNVTLKCLTEIAGVSVSQYEEQFVTLFTLTMCQLKQVSSVSAGRPFFTFMNVMCHVSCHVMCNIT